MNGDRRSLFESNAFGRDPTTRPADRITALQMLEEMGEHDSCEFCQRTAGLDVDKLQADMDATTATLRLYADDDDLRTKWPETSLEADDNQE